MSSNVPYHLRPSTPEEVARWWREVKSLEQLYREYTQRKQRESNNS